MGEWKTCTIADIGTVVGGATPSTKKEENYINGDIAWITPKDLSNHSGRYIAEGERNITELGLKSCSAQILPVGSVLFSSRAPIGYIAIAENEVCTNQGFKSVIPNAETESLFLYYLLKYNKNYIESMGSGTTFKEISGNTMKGIQVCVPINIEEQKKIASLLGCIDDKIELNEKINKNLEQQAQAIFKSWFVDFTPFNEPFKENPVGIQTPVSLKMLQIADIPHILETGRRPKGGAVAEGIPSVGAENVKTLGLVNLASVKFIPKEFAEKMKTGAVNGYELMLYKDGGKPGTFIPHFSMFGEGFPYENFFINEHVFKLDFYNRGYNEFMYFYLQTNYPYYWLSNNGGKAAVPGINQQDVNSIWTFAPENPKVKEFCDWVHPLFKCILTNCAKNVKLAALRDLLLPKLMSGELDVSAIDL
nr:restriction endonuclease subunit S [Phascolarctobacterium sp.]